MLSKPSQREGQKYYNIREIQENTNLGRNAVKKINSDGDTEHQCHERMAKSEKLNYYII